MAENFGKYLTNPWVLGGGAALGIVLLMMKGNDTANNGGSVVAASPEYNSAVLAYNVASGHEITQRMSIAADVQKTTVQADVTRQVATLAAISHIDDNQRQISIQRQQSNEGIMKATIAANTAVVIDMQQNANRLAIAGLDVTKQKIVSDANVRVAQVQAKAAKTAAKWNALGNIGGVAVKALTYA